MYGVTLLRRFGYSVGVGSKTATGASGLKVDFNLKVCHNAALFQAERASLLAVADEYLQNNDPSFYARACLFADHANNIVSFPNDITEVGQLAHAIAVRSRLQAPHLPYRELGVSQKFFSDVQVTASNIPVNGQGVFLMKSGRLLQGSDEVKRAVDGLEYSLSRLHSAGYVHTNVVRDNIVRFGRDVHVVDLDLSVPINGAGPTRIRIARDSARHQVLGNTAAQRLQSSDIENDQGVEIDWSAADDRIMGMNALFCMHNF